ncbi:MAG TPA: rhodanese-like domain-containing protein [Thermoanaerobaculia bacterium]|nr:rhodanese-like domain-containing protein [Thermoanaerobaculia bacterium]
MSWRRYALETATLIVAAVLCAFISNAIASRERKLVVVSTISASSARRAASSSPAPTPVVTQTTQTTITQTTATEPPAAKPQPAAVPNTPTVPNTKHPLNPAATREPAKTFNPHPDKPYIEIGFDDVKALHDNGVLFLDARRTSVYEDGHIPGARPFSVWESDIDDKVNKLFAERPDPAQQNLPIVVYCSGGDCEDSHMLAQKLWGIQFNNVYVYKDGFPDWQKRGEPVHTGTNP